MCALLMLFEDFGEDFCYSKVGKNITFFFIAIFFEGLSNNQGPTELVISPTIFYTLCLMKVGKHFFSKKPFFHKLHLFFSYPSSNITC